MGDMMATEGSYKIQQFAANSENEIKRLKAQLDLFWDKEVNFYKMFGLQDGMSIIECGSGPGFLTNKLLEAFPNSQVTALEIDPYLVNYHKKNVSEGCSGRCKIHEASIMETNFENDSFDFAISRLVLEHLPDPVGAAQEVNRILKQEGKVIFIDNDFEFHLRTSPDIPELKDLYDAYCKARYAEGGNPKIGRQLPGILKEADYINIDLQIVSGHNEVVGDEIFLKSEGSGIPAQLVKDCFLSQDVLDRISKKWHSLMQNKSHAIFRQLFMVVGEKKSGFVEEEKSSITTQKASAHTTISTEQLLSVGKDEAIQLIENFICKEIAELLDIPEDHVHPELSFSDIGVDSLAAVDLQVDIKSNLDIEISIATLLGDEKISGLSNQLFETVVSRKGNKDNHGAIEDWEEGEI